MKNNNKSRKYWWFLLLIIPCLLYYDLSRTKTKDDDYKKDQEKKSKLEDLWIENSIKNINSNQIYILENESGFFSDDVVIGIKIDKIIGDSVVIKKLKISNGYQRNYDAIVLDYDKGKDSAPSFTISKNTFSTYDSKNKYFPKLDFLKSKTEYKLQFIYELNTPYLSLDNTGLDNLKEIQNTTGNIFIGNFGKSGKIISIKNKKGNVQWIDTFPFTFNTDQYFRQAAIKLQTRNYDIDLGSSSEIIVLDSLGKQQIYSFEMQGHQTEIFRIK